MANRRYTKEEVTLSPVPQHQRVKDRTGLTAGRLTVRGFAYFRGEKPSRKAVWWCECVCGSWIPANWSQLSTGGTKSCGCLLDESRGNHLRTHGRSKTPEYESWQGMRKRCRKPSNKNYHQYGGHPDHPVQICDNWHDSFEAFIAKIGDPPPGKNTVERLNTSESTRNYSCGDCPQCKSNGWIFHCRWASQREQTRNTTRNRHLTIDGRTMLLADWAKESGTKSPRISKRLADGWCEKCSVQLPSNKRCPHVTRQKKSELVTINGVTKYASEWCAENGIVPQMLYYRKKKGWCLPCACTIPQGSGLRCEHR